MIARAQATVSRRHVEVSFTITILTAFATLFLSVMTATLAIMHHESLRAAGDAAEVAVTALAERTAVRVESLVAPLHAAVAVAGAALADPPATSDALAAVLEALPQAAAMTVAGPGGAPSLTRTADGRVDSAPDSRGEIWYATAIRAGGRVATTEVHWLPTAQRPGLVVVRALPQRRAVGLEIALDRLGAELAGQHASAHSVALLMDENGTVLAHSDPARALPPGVVVGTLAWRALGGSADALEHGLWTAHTTGVLMPGHTVAVDVGGEAWLTRLVAVPLAGGDPLLIAVAAPVEDFAGPIERAQRHMLSAGLGAAALGLLAMAITAKRITRPLEALTREAAAIGQLDLDRPLRVRSRITEVARLATSMQGMKATLHSFGQYVPKDLVRRLLSTGGVAQLGGERRVVTVMFTDIVGFTTLADRMDADQLMRLMSAYFEQVVVSLMADRAVIDKFIGDAVMALWNAPTEQPDHAATACLAALHCRLRCERLEAEFAERGWPGMPTRFGLCTGEAAVGNFGAADRLAYTALGATVNMAARLEGLNRHYGTAVLVTTATRAAAGPGFVFRRIDRVLPKGRLEPTDIHELVGLAPGAAPSDHMLELPAERIAACASWDAVVGDYLDGRFEVAWDGLERLDPGKDDQALHQLYLGRIRGCRTRPPAPGWTGVATFSEK